MRLSPCRSGLPRAALVLSASLALAGCRPAGTDKADADGKPPDSPHRISVAPAVIAAARIRAVPVTRERLDAIVELPGETAASADRVASVASPVAGRIEAVQARLGATVRRGDVLMTLRVPDLSRLRADVAAKRALSRTARQNAERVGELYAQHAASERDAQQSRAQADALEAEARSAGEVLTALGTSPSVEVANSRLTLRAPIAGTVIARNAIVGQPVSAEQVLATVGDTREVWFLGRAYESSLARIHVGQRAEVVLNAYPDRRFAGEVSYVSEQLDPTMHAATARVVLRNRDGVLRIGLFGAARIQTGTAAAAAPGAPTTPTGAADARGDGKQPALVVPEASVVQIGGHPTVFVTLAPGQFEAREIAVGAAAAGKVEITSGLRDGDVVVVDGAFTLKSIALRGSLAEGE